MARRNPAALIAARQRQEESLRDYNRATAANHRQKMVADWEINSHRKIQSREFYTAVDRVQAQHNDALIARRQRLAALLLREKEQHDAMLEGMAESDAQRRERLLQRAKELREQREGELVRHNRQRYDRLFRDRIDELRKAESTLKLLQVADARHEQLAMLAERRRKEEEEEVFFREQLEHAKLQANQRAQQDLETAHHRKMRLRADLDTQMELEKQHEREMAVSKQKEHREFMQQLHEEAMAEEMKQIERRQQREAIAREMQAMNAELKRVRQEEIEKLREEDQAFLETLRVQMEEEARRERDERNQRREAATLNIKEIQAQMSQKKEDERVIDDLWAKESDKEWEKREARWHAEQGARDQLLRNILAVRRQQIEQIRKREQDEKRQVEAERAEFREAVQREGDRNAVERQRRLSAAKKNEQFLRSQIQEHEEERALRSTALHQELTEQEKLISTHRDRIAYEMAQLEKAKPARYQHIPLLPRTRHTPF